MREVDIANLRAKRANFFWPFFKFCPPPPPIRKMDRRRCSAPPLQKSFLRLRPCDYEYYWKRSVALL